MLHDAAYLVYKMIMSDLLTQNECIGAIIELAELHANAVKDAIVSVESKDETNLPERGN